MAYSIETSRQSMGQSAHDNAASPALHEIVENPNRDTAPTDNPCEASLGSWLRRDPPTWVLSGLFFDLMLGDGRTYDRVR